MSLEKTIKDMTQAGKEASRELRKVSRARKDAALQLMAGKLMEREKAIRQENEKDLASAKEQGLSSAMLDRLTLDAKTLQSMAEALGEVAALPDPVGEVTGMWKRPNGLLVGRVRIPLGVIGFIYESRPNVTVDAASLCLKAGNAVILKGGSEAIQSNLILGKILREALEETGLPPAAIQVIPTTERDATRILLQQEEDVDVIIPRGGEGLIRFVTDHSRIPVLRITKGSAMFTWMSSQTWAWPPKFVSTQKCNGRACAMPWKPCSSTKALQMPFCRPFSSGSAMREWKSAAVREPWPSCLKQPLRNLRTGLRSSWI
jgi:glutamate-5-semialdehyde dehydrogenase